MLLRFGVSNFRSINERQEFSLIADAAIKDGINSLLSTSAPSVKEKILPVSVIYGPNASGKSNALRAFNYIKNQIIYSHYGPDFPRALDWQPFKLDTKVASNFTECDLDFVWNELRYNYGFSYKDGLVATEWLIDFPNGRKRQLFERDGAEAKSITLGSSVKALLHSILPLVRPDSLFVSILSQFNLADSFPVGTWAASTNIELAQFGRSRMYEAFNPRMANVLRKRAIDNRIVEFLKTINTGVQNFVFKEQDAGRIIGKTANLFESNGDEESKGENKRTILYAAHKSIDGEEVLFQLSDESTGTQKLLNVLGQVFEALDNGSLLMIDELDTSLHTLVAQKILDLFNAPRINPKGAQLVVTTHDTNLLGNENLRRDQVWFAEKDGIGATHLYPLTDFKARKGQNLEKGYLEGRFGAVPYSGDFSLFSNNSDQ